MTISTLCSRSQASHLGVIADVGTGKLACLLMPRIAKALGMNFKTRLQRSERGVAFLETVLILPLLMALTFGVAEFGSLASDKMAMQNAVRAGARISGSLGTQPRVDYYVVQSLQTASLGNSTLNSIEIYNQRLHPNGCSGVATNGCNVYNTSTYNLSQFTSDDANPAKPVCRNTDADFRFCPTSRENDYYGTTPDEPQYIGIKIRATHNSITGMVGSRTVEETMVVQIDPDTRKKT